MQKLRWFGGFGVTQGHQKHSHSIVFDFNRNYASTLYHFRIIARFSSKVMNFNPPLLHLLSPLVVFPFEFRRELWCHKTRVTGLSCGVICVILRLAVLIQYWSVPDTHTHTHRHTTTAYTALSTASRGKNDWSDYNQIFTWYRVTKYSSLVVPKFNP